MGVMGRLNFVLFFESTLCRCCEYSSGPVPRPGGDETLLFLVDSINLICVFDVLSVCCFGTGSSLPRHLRFRTVVFSAHLRHRAFSQPIARTVIPGHLSFSFQLLIPLPGLPQ